MQIGNIVYKTYSTELKERTANNKLYEFIGKMEPSIIAIYPHANPSLEYYIKNNENIQKHKYLGIHENISKSKDIATSRERFYKAIDNSLLMRPNTIFYYLISHLQPIDEENKIEWQHWRSDYLLMKFKNINCKFESIFKGNGVQMLKMECKNATNPNP